MGADLQQPKQHNHNVVHVGPAVPGLRETHLPAVELRRTDVIRVEPQIHDSVWIGAGGISANLHIGSFDLHLGGAPIGNAFLYPAYTPPSCYGGGLPPSRITLVPGGFIAQPLPPPGVVLQQAGPQGAALQPGQQQPGAAPQPQGQAPATGPQGGAPGTQQQMSPEQQLHAAFLDREVLTRRVEILENLVRNVDSNNVHDFTTGQNRILAIPTAATLAAQHATLDSFVRRLGNGTEEPQTITRMNAHVIAEQKLTQGLSDPTLAPADRSKIMSAATHVLTTGVAGLSPDEKDVLTKAQLLDPNAKNGGMLNEKEGTQGLLARQAAAIEKLSTSTIGNAAINLPAITPHLDGYSTIQAKLYDLKASEGVDKH